MNNPLGDAINRRARLVRAFLFIVSMGLAGCFCFLTALTRQVS